MQKKSTEYLRACGRRGAAARWGEGTEAQRFWRKVDKNGPVPTHVPHLGNCWVWTGWRDRKGYGGCHMNADRPNARAHRVAWERTNGPVPSGMMVLHKCDNPSCVRPDHLFVGSGKDNMADCAAKGRNNRNEGSRNPKAKLTEADVLEIRRLHHAERLTGAEIARRYCMSSTHVSAIIRRAFWLDV